MKSTGSAPFGFAGETLLSTPLPNYHQERVQLTALILLSATFWLLLVPYAVGKFVRRPHASLSSSSPVSVDEKQQKKSLPAGEISKRKGKKASWNRTTTKVITNVSTSSRNGTSLHATKTTTTNEGSMLINATVTICTIFCIATLSFIVLFGNSINSSIGRTIFEAPIFTKADCQRVLDMAWDAANRNHEKALTVSKESPRNSTIEGLLSYPPGWQKDRHTLYKTTDLNLVNDPFASEDRVWLADKFNRRLGPLLQRIYGIPLRSIRANDMFVVRYDSEDRPSLARHTDDSDISFNILLTKEFEGGGTRFWNRLTGAPFVSVQPAEVGQVLMHSALIDHEGLPVTSGTRYILVGFLAVDRMEPLSMKPTGMSWFSTYLSLPFMHTSFKAGYVEAHTRVKKVVRGAGTAVKWTDNRYVRSLFRDIVLGMEWLGDTIAPHRHMNLIESEDREAFLRSMDAVEHSSRSTWFAGQQLHLDVDGTVASKWSTRNEEAFKGEDL